MERDTDTESTCESVTDFTARIVQKCCEKRILMQEESGCTRSDIYQELSMEKKFEMRGSGEALEEKENEKPQGIRSAAKKTLKRLGDLYSDEGLLSSPVHRSEAKFIADGSPDKSAKPKARLARLAALANQIKEWEDDMSHPVIKKKEAEKIPRKKWTRDTPVSQGSPFKNKESEGFPCSAASTVKALSPLKMAEQSPKAVAWDRAVLANLEAQGFARCESNQHLVYDYSANGDSPRKCLSPSLKMEKSSTPVTQTITRSPEKSPKKPTVVREMAAKYEESPPKGRKSVKDPAELSLAERRAIFEKNGSTPILPKAPLTMAVPSQSLGQSSPSKPIEERIQRTVLSSRVAPFESKLQSGADDFILKDSVRDEIAKRRAEIEDLNNRWKKATETATKKDTSENNNALKTFEVNIVRFIEWMDKTHKKVTNLELVPQDEEKVLERIREHDSLHNEILRNNILLNDLTENGSHLMSILPDEAERIADKVQYATDKFSLLVDVSDSLEGLRQFQLTYQKLQTWIGCIERRLTRYYEHKFSIDITEMKSEIVSREIEMDELLENGLKLIQNISNEEGKRLKSKIDSLRKRYNDLKLQTSEIFKEAPEPPPMPIPPAPPLPASTASHTVLRTRKSSEGYPSLNEVKRIRLSPPKPGRLYPSVSDIETETESEIPTDREEPSYEEDESESDQSLGRHIVHVASASKLGRHSTLKSNMVCSPKHVDFDELSDSSSRSRDESRVLHEIDDFLDEALGEPSPKRSKENSFDEHFSNRGMVSYPSGSYQSVSFEYSDGKASEEQEEEESNKASGGLKLVHTVSVYRKQQGQLYVKPTTVIKHFDQPLPLEERQKTSSEDEDELVAKKIHDLLLEVSKQQTIIAQSSQALNLCSSTLEFSGSTEQIEGERLLLIATNRRQACLHELQRLRVEKTLRPGGSSMRCEKGDLIIKEIVVPIKNDVIRRAARDENCYYIICLARCGDIVLATEMVPALPKNLSDGKLVFRKPLEFKSLYGDFAITVEVYGLLARSKEILPHEIKYHINPKKDKKATPKKAEKKLLIGGRLESPGGPNAVRSPLFQMNGFIVFSLRDINKPQFTLNKVPYDSVVEGTVRVTTRSSMSLDSEHRGFLTMFEDISGFGAWHRRWCLLRGDKISYWKYPEDENAKVPMDTIDLSQCITDEIAAVSRELCARPNTFLIEISRPTQSDDKETLAMHLNSKKNTTTIRHLLSADTREERLQWCEFLNKTLRLLKAWGKY